MAAEVPGVGCTLAAMVSVDSAATSSDWSATKVDVTECDAIGFLVASRCTVLSGSLYIDSDPNMVQTLH